MTRLIEALALALNLTEGGTPPRMEHSPVTHFYDSDVLV